MARTMTAKYPGVCTTCSQRFTAGTQISYAGRGQTSHVVCEMDQAASDAEYDAYDTAVIAGAFTATGEAEYRARSAKRSARRSAYRSYGRGRCEDSPACGCCD